MVSPVLTNRVGKVNCPKVSVKTLIDKKSSVISPELILSDIKEGRLSTPV